MSEPIREVEPRPRPRPVPDKPFKQVGLRRDYRRTKTAIGIRRQRAPERRLVEALVEAYLESGAQASEAVEWAGECYKALNLFAREAEDLGEPIQLSDLKLLRKLAIACVKSGAKPFVAAERANMTLREIGKRRQKLHGTIDQEERREAARRKGGGKNMRPGSREVKA